MPGLAAYLVEKVLLFPPKKRRASPSFLSGLFHCNLDSESPLRRSNQFSADQEIKPLLSPVLFLRDLGIPAPHSPPFVDRDGTDSYRLPPLPDAPVVQ